MAFKPKQEASSAPAVPPAASALQGALRQDSSAVSSMSETKRQRAENDARVQSLRVMNAARMLGPVLNQVVSEGGSDEDQAQRFASLITRANKMAVDAALLLGFTPTSDRDKWAVNVLERTFSEALATPASAAATDSGRAVVRAVVDAAKARALDVPEYEDINEDAAITIARIQSLGPVLRAQSKFDFARPRETTITEVATCMDEEVVKLMTILVPPATGAPERRTVYTVLSQEAGRFMEEAWLHEAAKAIAALRKRTVQEREAWKAANPQGLPIETVLARFRAQMARMGKLVKQLRP